jgi:hypothetical protein
VCAWALVSVSDHAHLFAHYRSGEEPDTAQLMADDLVARHIDVAAAGYWRAYKLTFLAQERVTLASTDVVRIDEYQRRAQEAGDRLLVLSPNPCPTNQPPVSGWYLCEAGR